jgi:hypothetical protein
MNRSSIRAITSVPRTNQVKDMPNWSRAMGEKRGLRDRAASLQTQTIVDREYEQHAACRERWPNVVAAMRSLVASYNEGASLAVLTLVEDPVNSVVTLESARHGQHALVMALDGADVSVRTRRADGDLTNDTRWVSLDRSDDAAAEYLLRNWMEQL